MVAAPAAMRRKTVTERNSAAERHAIVRASSCTAMPINKAYPSAKKEMWALSSAGEATALVQRFQKTANAASPRTWIIRILTFDVI